MSLLPALLMTDSFVHTRTYGQVINSDLHHRCSLFQRLLLEKEQGVNYSCSKVFNLCRFAPTPLSGMAWRTFSMLLLQAARRALVCFGSMYATGAQCSCRFASTCRLQARKEHIISLQHLQWYANLNSYLFNRKTFSRGTNNRSVHRDALSAAALRFEATPPPPGLRWSGRASDSALHCFVEEVSPVFHHRLKFKNGL